MSERTSRPAVRNPGGSGTPGRPVTVTQGSTGNAPGAEERYPASGKSDAEFKFDGQHMTDDARTPSADILEDEL